MNTALTNAETARLFVSGLTPEVHELLKSSIQEKEFETSMQAAIRGMR